MNNKILSFLGAAALFLSPFASATIIDAGDHVLVNGTKWLDLTETVGITYEMANNNYDNYHIATQDEFLVMWNEMTTLGDGYLGDIASTYSYTENEGEILYNNDVNIDFRDNWFSRYFGVTSTDGNSDKMSDLSSGFFHGESSLSLGGIEFDYWVQGRDGVDFQEGYEGYGGNFDGRIQSNQVNRVYGFFLVENEQSVAVPEPSILALMGLGLIGMFGVNRRKLQA